MNRELEYELLCQEMVPPEALGAAVAQALTRARRRRTHRRLTLCACAPLVVLVVFTALVNLLPGFAYACGQLPGFRDLAKAVAMSPSLRAAVENKYVQTIGQEQTKYGITMRVEYVIADRQQWIVFYRLLQSDNSRPLSLRPGVSAADGSQLTGVSMSYNDPAETADELRSVQILFVKGDAPAELRMDCTVYNQAPSSMSQGEALASFRFQIIVDKDKLQQGQIYSLNKAFEVDGQKVILSQVEIYPSHMAVSFDDDPENTAWPVSLGFHIEDENGKQYETIRYGISGTGYLDKPMGCNYYAESPFFSNCKHLTAVIDNFVWLDKDRQRARIDLKNSTAEGLPECVVLTSATRSGDSWILNFTETAEVVPTSQSFNMKYWDEQGREYDYHSFSVRSSDGYDGHPATLEESFTLENYPSDIVYLGLGKTRTSIMEQSIILPVK